MREAILLCLAAAGLLAACGAAMGAVENPSLTTDRAVDTRSARTIVASLVRPGMSDEEKVLTLFHWLRRVIYHSGPEEPLRHDFGWMVNVFGYGSCYMQTHPLSHLYGLLGFPTRNWLHNGHHMLEAFYSGAWHCLDPHMTFYVYNRAAPPAVAGVAELQADPTLAADARKEGRAGPAHLICGDAPAWFSGRDGWTLEGPFPPQKGAEAEFGAIRLRRGERYVRIWQAGRFYRPHAFLERYPPYHTCGPGSDRRDPINFSYWEPYAWREGSAASGRHIGSGYLEFTPDLKRESGWQDGVIRFSNLTSDGNPKRPALRPQSPEMESEVIFSAQCPYLIAGAALELTGRLGTEGDRITVSVSREWAGPGGDRKWDEKLKITRQGAFKQTLDLTPQVEGSLSGYWVRIRMQSSQPQSIGLDAFRLRTDFQLNPYALPQLLPGSNRIKAAAARSDTPWRVRLAWHEGIEWRTPKAFEATVNGAAREQIVEVAGPPFPRMESLEFWVDP
ncbi:MAG: hypothetical protein IT210_08255 [Armatimonadetes bacterium]|nr:hypothetical protein [Armatimonadota bacterium]